jgi:hypothetical protein
VALFIVLFLILTVVVSIGGAVDLVHLFKSLRDQVVDETDDGRVR